MNVVEALAVYPGYMPDLPDVLLLRRPPALRTSELLAGKYAIQICETPQELFAVQKWAKEPAHVITVGGRRTVDLRGPLGPPGASPMAWIAGYAPPEHGWPWLVVARVPEPQPGFARGIYATDVFSIEADWLAHIQRLYERFPNRDIRTPDDRSTH
jgi:hypothetical protein